MPNPPTPKARGEAVELLFMARAALLGCTVLKPMGDSAPYDVVVDNGPRMLRVQVKSASVLDTRRSAHRYAMTAARGCEAKIPYDPSDADFLAAYIPPQDAWYIVPIVELRKKVRIYFSPHRPSKGRMEPFLEAWGLLASDSPIPRFPDSPIRISSMLPAWLTRLNADVVACTRCPRLVAHCRKIAREKRRAYMDWEYWGKPVPSFGDPDARVLILGLAPGAHGSNRTGRPFTGDGSGFFMYPVLHRAGFANQPQGTHRGDGLELKDAYITSVGRCAPPDNKPTPQELANCSPFLDRELAGLKKVKVVVILGKIAFDGYLAALKRQGMLNGRKSQYVFGHGVQYKMPHGVTMLCSYHPSVQNTNTGRLNEKMFLEIFREAKRLVNHATD